jgi:hypothetical protein
MTTNRQHLRLVDLRPVDRAPPAPRLAVRISAFAARGGPFGHSRSFRLTEHDIDELLLLAERLENGRRQ